MICPSCKTDNGEGAEACFTCGRALGALTQGAIIAKRYEVLKPLGRGGMGMVYQAHDRMLEETVAIKVLRSEFVGTPEMAQRFRHEIKLARKVSHRNVCRIHEYGEDEGLRYISMEFLEGTDLKQIVRERGRFAAEEAFEVAIQVADGLQAIHDVGIIHRDLKTPNIMRDGRGVIKLMDFGIAKEQGGKSGPMTSTGQIMGTPEYMSPEQCRGERIDFRSDLYALGVVAFEIFTGHVPFHGDTPVATIFKHIQDPVPLGGGDFAELIPPPMIPVLRKALAKDRNDRYESAQEIADALRQARLEAAARDRTAQALVPEPAPPPTQPVPVVEDRRRSSRLDIFLDLVVKRVGTLGTVLQEERTIAENVSREGARVKTTMTALGPGDILRVEEVGGDFATRAEVRNAYLGSDHVRRLNLRFLDRPAPDRLVRVDGTS
jgi:serine/threonine-protein kinase